MKTVVITGINGFLGSNLANSLKDSYKIIGLVRTKKSSTNPFSLYESSVKGIEELFENNKIDFIIHTATVYRHKKNVNEILKTNLLLPITLYELCNLYNVKAFINTDTFFNQTNTEYSYLGTYTLSKQQALTWLKSISDSCKLINMKLHHIYGPGDSEKKFVSSMLRKLKYNEPTIPLTPGEQKRDFIFITDVCEAYKIILKSYKDLDGIFAEIEVGRGKAISIREFLETARNVECSSSVLDFGNLPYRDGEIMGAEADIFKLEALGWRPKYSLRKGLKLVFDSL